MSRNSNDLIMRNSIFGWIVAGAGVLLLIPLIAMQFTPEVNWSPGDFAIMGVMMIGFASLFVLIARRVAVHRRVAIGIAVFVAFLLLWAELAVGIFTNWGS